jgi:hypothetical protein
VAGELHNNFVVNILVEKSQNNKMKLPCREALACGRGDSPRPLEKVLFLLDSRSYFIVYFRSV